MRRENFGPWSDNSGMFFAVLIVLFGAALLGIPLGLYMGTRGLS
jgi:hypothetical protein